MDENRSGIDTVLEIKSEDKRQIIRGSSIISIQESPNSVVIDFILDWVSTFLIGFLVVSYWRGTWLLIDIYLCDQPNHSSTIDGSSFCFISDVTSALRTRSACRSYGIGLILLCIGLSLSWTGQWFHTFDGIGRLPMKKALSRFFILYALGASTVFIWRGIWYATDAYIWTSSINNSMILTTVIGFGVCLMMNCGASVLAPPAIFLLDGPSYASPPIAKTVLETYYGLKLPKNEFIPSFHWSIKMINLVLTYIVLPVFVVWFWRGCWGLLDILLWGFTISDTANFNQSLGYGSIIAIACLFLGSNDVFYLFPKITNKLLALIISRLRTLILAIGTVSFWRVVWYVWDDFLGKSTQWSGWISHCVGILGLLMMGCMSSIIAPPSTIGVDCLVHPDATEEALFRDVPMSAESLGFLSFFRKPPPSFVSNQSEADANNLEEFDLSGDKDSSSSSESSSLPTRRENVRPVIGESNHDLSSSMPARIRDLNESSFLPSRRNTITLGVDNPPGSSRREDFASMNQRSFKKHTHTSEIFRSR